MDGSPKPNVDQVPPARPYYRSIVAKLGTGVLTGGSDTLDEQLIASIARQVGELVRAQAEVILVTSGAIAVGRSVMGGSDAGRSVTNLQALAAIGQHRLMRSYERAFSENGLIVGQALVTRTDLNSKRAAANIRRTLRELLGLGVVPIVNENDVVAAEEISETLGDNDALSAALANVMASDLLVLLTDRDGLYDSDPRSNADARLITNVDRVTDEIRGMAAEMPGEQGRGGMASKVRAAAEATSWGATVVVANGHAPDVLIRAAQRDEIGTRFNASGRRRPSARRRSLGRLFARGHLTIDEGAAAALRRGASSLLAVGVRDVQGEFQAGDIVEIRGPDEAVIARGAVAYPSGVMRRLAGMQSAQVRDFVKEAQPDAPYAGDEMVHRDHMTLL